MGEKCAEAAIARHCVYAYQCVANEATTTVKFNSAFAAFGVRARRTNFRAVRRIRRHIGTVTIGWSARLDQMHWE